MNIIERLILINTMCSELSWSSSRLDKEYIVSKYKGVDEQLSKDIDYVFEILSGMHKLGYTFLKVGGVGDGREQSDISLKEYLAPLYSIENKSGFIVVRVCMKYGIVANYLAPILNREWRIGINKSQLTKTILTPMLAKKYEPGKHCKNVNEEYYITEKLDGNRCIASYSIEKGAWEFTSRSGKSLKVSFDMLDMPKENAYDGEILSIEQIDNPGQRNFNDLSGRVNSIYGDKSGLVYVIFDIPSSEEVYSERRKMLNNIMVSRCRINSNVTILPIINCLRAEQMSKLSVLLELIENKGGEGLMINLGSRKYEHKRTDALLKVKSVYTMDMLVDEIEYGTGKYTDAVGAIHCYAIEKDSNIRYECYVGSGLSDDERYIWAEDPSKIIGKIVEVAYFSLSQDKNCAKNVYSLRFPRFKGIREDKNDTSVD